ncbi:MAG: TRAP transporter large permease [Chloroflexota bacterium]
MRAQHHRQFSGCFRTALINLVLLFGLFFLFILLGMPIGFSMGISAVAVLVFGLQISAPVVATKMVGMIDSWTWLAIPLFIFLGNLMTVTGITERLVTFSQGLVGHIKGGLSHVSVVTNTLMAGMSGSITADAAAVGSLFGPSMYKAGYPRGYTAGIIAAGAVIGPMIPPSIAFIMIGAAGNVSILRLWLGGAVPGLVIAVALITAGYIVARLKGYRAEAKVTWGQRVRTFVPALPALVIPIIIIGGMRLGLFTATEAGAVGVVYTLIVGTAVYRELKLKAVWATLLGSAKAAAKTFFIIAAAGIFSWVLTIMKADAMIMGIVKTFATPLIFLVMVSVIFTILGFFIEGPALVLIFIPLLMPIAREIGVDPVHFGVVFGLVNLVGALTPPVANAMYMACAVTGATPEQYIVDGWPVIVPLFLVILVVIFFPPLSTFLPNLIMG